ncbi:MAG: penicillin acylase family protein [Haliea sp.]
MTVLDRGWIRTAMARTRAFLSAPFFIVLLGANGSSIKAEDMLTAQSVSPPAGSVRLMRDEWGLAHIYANTERDGYFGLGYALGEDRLTQVLLTYVIVQGRSAEVFGRSPSSTDESDLSDELQAGLQDPVASDLRMMQGRYLEDARNNVPKLSGAYRTNVEAFTAGIWQYMKDNPETVPAWAPKLEAAMPLAVYAALTSGDPAAACSAKLSVDDKTTLAMTAEENADMASNAWAVSPERSATGDVIFSSDSHGGIMANGPMFYTWRMKAGDLDVLAHDFTGAISMVLGHSDSFGWGWTEGPRHTGDCYAVKTESDNPATYRFDGENNEIISTPYTINVKDDEPVTGAFEYTGHNGVRSLVVKRDGTEAYVASSAYSGRAGFADQQYYQMAKARTGDEFMDALAAREIYPANMLAGGRDGTILYIRPGRVPIRKDDAFVHQLLDGNSSATAWAGIHPVEDLVRLRNPAPGYIANTNVSPDMMYPAPLLHARDFPEYFAFREGQINGRQQRLIELLDQDRKLTFNDAIDIALDTKIIGTDLWGATLTNALHMYMPEFRHQSPAHGQFVAALGNFNGRFDTNSQGALYHVYFREALIETAPDQVDEIVLTVEGGEKLTPERSLAVANAIDSAYHALITDFGTTDLVFGDAHRVIRGNHSEKSGGAVIAVGKDLINHRPLVLNGHTVSVRAALHANIYQRPEGSTKRVLNAGARVPFVVGFSEPVKSYGLLAFGHSNDPTSTHYADQLQLFTNTRMKSNRFDFSDLKGHIKEMKVLQTLP